MQSFTVLIASRGTTNKRDHCDEVREGYSGASITCLELVLLQAIRAAVIKSKFGISLGLSEPCDSCGDMRCMISRERVELGHDDVVRFLTTNLNEQKAANTKLNTVALRKGANKRAVA